MEIDLCRRGTVYEEGAWGRWSGRRLRWRWHVAWLVGLIKIVLEGIYFQIATENPQTRPVWAECQGPLFHLWYCKEAESYALKNTWVKEFKQKHLKWPLLIYLSVPFFAFYGWDVSWNIKLNFVQVLCFCRLRGAISCDPLETNKRCSWESPSTMTAFSLGTGLDHRI